MKKSRKIFIFSGIAIALIVIAVIIVVVVLFAQGPSDDIDYNDSSYRLVNTNSGPIRGIRQLSQLNDSPFYSFLGIQYGKSPIADLRFKAPIIVDPWIDTLNAFDFGNECVQKERDKDSFYGDEDCLYLNVYVSDIDTPNKAVIFYIHGGAFNSGASRAYGADFFMDEDIILITFNYRVGALGFLSLGTPEYSGNMGLKDQALALRWINENISGFGGDPNRITIVGESAGAASAHLQILAPQNRDLYSKAIIMSGSALNTWSYYDLDDHINIMSQYSGYNNINELIEFLLNVDPHEFAQQFAEALYDPTLFPKILDKNWAPIIESNSAVNPFLTVTPEYIFEDNFISDKDVMFGFVDMEAYFIFAPDFYSPDYLVEFNEKIEMILPLRTNLPINFDSDIYREYVTKVKRFYFAEQPIHENLFAYGEFMSDVWFNYGIDQSVKMHAEKSSGNTFYYKFSVEGQLNLFKNYSYTNLIEGLHGATHADDVCYLFRVFDDVNVDEFIRLLDPMPDLSEFYTELELKAINNMVQLWTSFAKTGVPSANGASTILPVNMDNMNNFNINNNGVDISADRVFKERMEFWDETMTEYNSRNENQILLNKNDGYLVLTN